MCLYLWIHTYICERDREKITFPSLGGNLFLSFLCVYFTYHHMLYLVTKCGKKKSDTIFSVKPVQFISCFPSSQKNEIEILKAENDRLKAETGNTAKPARPPSESASSTSSSSSRQSLGLSLNNLNIAESVTSGDCLPPLPESKHASSLTGCGRVGGCRCWNLENIAHHYSHSYPLKM